MCKMRNLLQYIFILRMFIYDLERWVGNLSPNLEVVILRGAMARTCVFKSAIVTCSRAISSEVLSSSAPLLMANDFQSR